MGPVLERATGYHAALVPATAPPLPHAAGQELCQLNLVWVDVTRVSSSAVTFADRNAREQPSAMAGPADDPQSYGPCAHGAPMTDPPR